MDITKASQLYKLFVQNKPRKEQKEIPAKVVLSKQGKKAK